MKSVGEISLKYVLNRVSRPQKMSFLSMFLYLVFVLVITAQSQSCSSEIYSKNSDSCPNDKKCTFIEFCPVILNLMNRNLLPIHRFRQAICGYDSSKPLVCCDVDGNVANPTFTQEDGSFFTRSNSISECGKSFVRSSANTAGIYPFIARIGFRNAMGEIKYPCSGVILNERTILTTASCALAKSDDYKLYSIIVGQFNTDTDSGCDTQKNNISYVIKHPNYNANTFTNNIVMLRLRESIRYTATVQPICLPPGDRYIDRNIDSVLVGWGKLTGQTTTSCEQQSLKMRIISNRECSSYYNQGLSVELCARGNEMPCAGYSGSPLLYKYGDTHFLLGILSYGSNCNMDANFPSVFVDVQRYISWILNNC
ncbi:chymotrypsin-like protease CTRL-1 [Hylaeus volcanicus]|uniref:chymotrypsin-like protease CTRL-1 n=1 Tax=Hylaeus volcanicus TaxID=313075 RepID=UPI0023B77EAC|nr:chymotrypsin-like protease CTRL-1 [Hylaeus volcanicus]